jgi:hypothetical protein
MKDFFGLKEIVVKTNTLRDSTYRFEILNPFSRKPATYQLPEFKLPEHFKNDIAVRHVQVQTQKAYFEKYKNIVRLPAIDSTAFYGKPDEEYFLDKYARFKVMEEVMREYVKGVLVRKRKDGFHFFITAEPNTTDKPNRIVFNNEPLVLLDGLPVFDLNRIMAFDPHKIQKLDVITNRYYHGSFTYDGLVSYTTYKGDLGQFPLDSRALLMEYEGLQLQREFYAPTYATPQQKSSRLLDLRNLLYWSPDISTEKDGQCKQEFYTSDQAGKYLVVVQGISPNGLPGSTTFTFEVKSSL